MGWQACVSAIRGAAGIDLSDDEVERILDDILERKEEAKARLGLGDDAALSEAARRAADDARMSAAIEKRNALITMKARIDRRARIDEAAATIGKAGKPLDLPGAIQAEIHGINTPTRGGRFSAEGEWHTRARQYVGGLTVELERAGLLPAARSGALEHEWTNELYELSKRDAGEAADVGRTGSKEALQIAEIVHRYTNLARENLNRAGAWVGDYAGYIARTSHDPDKIRRAGFEAWRDAILADLDKGRTFAGVDDPGQFLRGVWHALVTGVHLTEGFQGFKDPAFKGPGNLAKRLSQERVLHFRDADGWRDYQKQFGTGTPIEAVLHSLDRAARSEALMRRWGTNPRAEFAGDLRYLAEKYRDIDPAAVDRLRQAEQDLSTRFDYLDGTANMPANRLGAKVGSAVRLWESMSKLGMVAFTHLSVATTKAAELRYQGVGLLGGYGDFLHSLMRGRGAGETRELADLLLAGTEGMSRDIVARFEPDDTMPGTLSKLANTYFKWTGLTYLLNAQKTGAEFMLARHLGSLVDRSYGELPEATQRALSQFDISPAEWELLRRAPDHKEIDGRAFLTPDAGRRADAAAVEGHLRGAGAIGEKTAPEQAAGIMSDWRDRLALKLHAYFNDVSEKSVVTPGIAERALFLGGNRPGTLWGEALRFIAQFKTWPAAVIRQGIGRELYGGQGRAAAIAGVLHMAIGSAITGYLVMSLKDMLKGRTPRAPDTPATWEAALMQGGGLGILGDFLFGDYNRFGQNFSETLLGPALGQGVSSIIDLWNRAKEGKDLAPEAFRTALNNTPFVNLFYTRLAADYLFLWNVQEAMSPGFLRRYERRVQQQNRQTFWLSPSQTAAGGSPVHLPSFGTAASAAPAAPASAGSVRMPRLGG